MNFDSKAEDAAAMLDLARKMAEDEGNNFRLKEVPSDVKNVIAARALELGFADAGKTAAAKIPSKGAFGFAGALFSFWKGALLKKLGIEESGLPRTSYVTFSARKRSREPAK